MKIKKDEYDYNRATHCLGIKVRSLNPNIKGARAKAQLFLKSKGVHDAMVFYHSHNTYDGNSWVYFEVSSPTLMIKEMVKGVKL